MTAGSAVRAREVGGPAVQRRRLAAALRVRREQAELTISDVAGQLEWSAAKISRIENAKVSILPRDVRHLLDAYGVLDSAERELLVSLAGQARRKSWWHDYGIAIPDWHQPYAALEADAALLRCYHPELVPALLRTPGYHSALSGTASGADDPEAGQVARHLAEASRRPGVTVQVLPFAAGAHPALDDPFIIMSFPGPDDPDIAYPRPAARHAQPCG